jgi:hypothetical protein
MIHGMVTAIRSDTKILTHWLRGEAFDLQPGEEKEQRVQLAAFRMLAAITMVFSALWALHIITFVVTFPVKVLVQLSLAVGFYAAAHDVFIMSQNANQVDFTPMKPKPYLFGLFKGQEVSDEEQARKFSHGTFFQPIWMWLYVNRSKIKHHANIDVDDPLI